MTITIYVNTVTISQVYAWLLAAGLEEHIGLARVDVVDDGSTVAAVGGGCPPPDHPNQQCWAFDGAIQLRDDLLLDRPNYAVGHEYGHVWENYYRWIVWRGSFDAYLEARGLLGDSRVGQSKCWQPYEMLAEDYRTLFGSDEALTLSQCNRDIPPARDVLGLRDFLGLTFTANNPPPGY